MLLWGFAHYLCWFAVTKMVFIPNFDTVLVLADVHRVIIPQTSGVVKKWLMIVVSTI